LMFKIQLNYALDPVREYIYSSFDETKHSVLTLHFKN